MDNAISDLEQELLELGQEEEALLESVKQTVGNMSDLRYGRLANNKLRDEVMDGLQGIQKACKRKS